MNVTLFCFISLLIFQVWSQIYISPTGNDANNGSFVSPLATFSRALQMSDLSKPSFIEFMDGNYFNMKMELRNIQTSNITIRSSSGNTKTFIYKPDISAAENITANYNALFISRSSGVYFRGITFIEDSNSVLTGLGSLLFLIDSKDVSFFECRFQNGKSIRGGGASVIDSSGISFTRTQFINNSAKRYDRVLETLFTENNNTFFKFSTIKMTGNAPFFIDGDFILNTGIGGGLYSLNSTLNFNLCLFKNNTASSGGALFQNDHTNITTTNSIFDSNLATYQGSLIYSTYNNLKNSFVVANTNIKDHICKVWYCKVVYSESWENSSGYKLTNYSPEFAFSIDIVLIIISVLIITSGAAQFFCIFCCDLFFKKKKRKPSQNELIDKDKVQDKKEEPKSTTTEVQEEQKKESLIPEKKDEAPDDNNTTVEEEQEKEIQKETQIIESGDDLPSNVGIIETITGTYENVSNQISTNYITPILDTGIFSTTLQWMFSLSGLTYSNRIPMVWRIAHSFFFCVLFIGVSIRAFFTTFAVPTIFYDYFDIINMIFGILEYVLLFAMPCVVYFSLVVGTNMLKRILFRERHPRQFATIVIGTTMLLVIGDVVAILTTFLVLKVYRPGQTYLQLMSNFIYIVYWTLTSNIIVFLILVVVLLVAFMTSRITDFFNTVEYLAKKGEFSYEEAVVNYARLKQFLSNTAFSISYFLVPLFLEFGGTIIIGIIMEIWGIEGFFIKGTRYAIIVCFGIIILFLLISFAVVTQWSAYGKTLMYNLIIKVGNDGNIKKYTEYEDEEVENKKNRRKSKRNQAKNMVKEIHRFNEFLSTNLFEFSIFGLLPLYINTIISYATIFASLFAAAKSVQSSLSSSLYSY